MRSGLASCEHVASEPTVVVGAFIICVSVVAIIGEVARCEIVSLGVASMCAVLSYTWAGMPEPPVTCGDTDWSCVSIDYATVCYHFDVDGVSGTSCGATEC